MLNKQEVLFEDKKHPFGWRETRVSSYKRHKKLQRALDMFFNYIKCY